MKKLIAFTLLLFGLVCCKPKTETEVIELPALRASSVYNRDSVASYLKKYENLHKQTADNYYERGYEEKNRNPKKAIYLLKRAITLNPSYESYKELGVLLLTCELYEEAVDLYNFLLYKGNQSPNTAYIFKAPDIDIYYGEMLSNYLKYKYMDSYLIDQARQEGLDITALRKKLFSDSRLLADTSLLAFKFFTEEDLEKYRESPANFKNFLSQFKDSSSTFEINEKDVQKFDYSGFYSEYEGPEEIDPKMESTVFFQERQDNSNAWVRYNFKYINDYKNFKAVIYAVDTSENACPIDMRMIYFSLVTYANNGKVLDHKIVAKQCGTELSTLKYNAGKYTVSNYKCFWKNPFDKSDFDNELIKKEYVNTNNYGITPEGKIQDINAPINP